MTDDSDGNGGAESATVQRCDYCRLPIPGSARILEREGVTYQFCSATCRDELKTADRVFTEYHGSRRLATGISALDSSLPQGVPRNSFVLLTDLAGTRSEAIQAELVWRALQRGEPVVYVSFLEPPVSVVQEFVTLEWNVLPSLEADDLHIVDCFTYRSEDRERMHERMNAWNRHLWAAAKGATTTVRDPTDVGQLHNRLDAALARVGAGDEGIVVVDSLTELGSLVQPVQAYNFVKDIRADICKGRFVPVFAGATVTSEKEKFPHDLEYMVDGIVELRLNDDLVEDTLIKQLRVRKMSGVLAISEWATYEYTAGKGIVTFDPVAQMEAAQDDGPPGDQTELDDVTDTSNEAGDSTDTDETTRADGTDGGSAVDRDAGAEADADPESDVNR